MRFAEREQIAIYLAFHILAAHPRFQLCAIYRSEVRRVAVGKHDIHRLHIVNRLAIHNRVRAAGIVAERAANIAAAAGARVRREEQAAGRNLVVQLVEDNARLSSHPAFFGVQFHHIAHVPREVHHDGVRNRLPGEARACAAWKHRHIVAIRGLHHGDNIVRIPWQNDAHRLYLVDARVRAVQHASHIVKAHFARDIAPQFLHQFPCVRFDCPRCHSANTPRANIDSVISQAINACPIG